MNKLLCAKAMKRLLSVIGLIIFFGILCFVLLFIWIFANPETNVRFQSSDGQWHDHEVLFKGREFESIVVYFELYKLQCDRSDVKLQRVTTAPGKNALARYYDDPKWKVLFTEKIARATLQQRKLFISIGQARNV